MTGSNVEFQRQAARGEAKRGRVPSGHSIAGMRVCGPGSLLGCREAGPGPRTAECYPTLRLPEAILTFNEWSSPK